MEWEEIKEVKDLEEKLLETQVKEEDPDDKPPEKTEEVPSEEDKIKEEFSGVDNMREYDALKDVDKKKYGI